jgi:hypothetical protein
MHTCTFPISRSSYWEAVALNQYPSFPYTNGGTDHYGSYCFPSFHVPQWSPGLRNHNRPRLNKIVQRDKYHTDQEISGRILSAGPAYKL